MQALLVKADCLLSKAQSIFLKLLQISHFYIIYTSGIHTKLYLTNSTCKK